VRDVIYVSPLGTNLRRVPLGRGVERIGSAQSGLDYPADRASHPPGLRAPRRPDGQGWPQRLGRHYPRPFRTRLRHQTRGARHQVRKHTKITLIVKISILLNDLPYAKKIPNVLFNYK